MRDEMRIVRIALDVKYLMFQDAATYIHARKAARAHTAHALTAHVIARKGSSLKR